MSRVIVGWMFPDMLNLHGDRGNLMALARVAQKIGVAAEIRRHDQPGEAVALDEYDMLVFCAGELRAAKYVAQALAPQQQELQEFAACGRPILAIGSSGAILAQQTRLTDNSSFPGLGLLDMECQEREQVYGDDLWFRPADMGLCEEIIGNQIQVMDTQLGPKQAAFGQLIYGRGNSSDQVSGNNGPEGARSGNVIFTNCLGPLLVKNPLLARELLLKAAMARGEQITAAEAEFEFEQRSAELIRDFIRKKM